MEEVVLNAFKGKIEDAIVMVQAMDAEEKLKAVHYWNVVSEKLQDIVNNSVEDISALAFQMEGEKSGLPDYIDASQLVSLGMAPSFMARYISNPGESTTGLNGKPSKESRHINGELVVTENVPGELELLPNYEIQQVAVEVENDVQEQQVANEEVVINANEMLQVTERAVEETLMAQLTSNQDAAPADPVAETFLSKVIHETIAEEAIKSNTVHLMITAESQPPASKGIRFQPNVLRRGRRFKKKDAIEKTVVAEVEGYKCEICRKAFCTPSQLATHSWSHTKPYICTDCQARFSTKGNLIVHRRRHSGEKPFACFHCVASFSTNGNLKRHLKCHSGEKPFQCSQCGARFTENKSLKVHMRRHTGERPYQCNVCLKSFTQSSILHTHMSMHLNQRQHLCNQCGKSFRQKSQLRLHEQRHAGLRKYECSVCPYKFLTKGDMERHKRIHTGERPYVCKECKKAFTRQQTLNEHMNRHWGLKPYKCKYCKKGFVELSACHKHMKGHDKPKSKANCSKSKANSSKLKATEENPSKQSAADSGKSILISQKNGNAQTQPEVTIINGENTGVTTYVIQKLARNAPSPATNAAPLQQRQMPYN